MTTIAPLPARAGAPSNTAVARVQKTAESGGLHGEYRGEQGPRERRGQRIDRRAVSRAGTFETAPLWYGPRLRAPFVAQIIGQVLGDVQAAPQPAYRGDDARVALMVDRCA